MRIGALVLAAGSSSRLGEPKQLLKGADGQPLVSSTVHALHAAGCDPIVVVLGAHAEDVALALLQDATNVHLVPNRAWSEGMGSSIRAGIAAMSTHGMMRDVDAVLIAACDMPAAGHAHFAALRVAASGGNADGDARAALRVASEYTTANGRSTRGIPAVVPRADWPALLTLEGDRGAKGMFEGSETRTVPLVNGNFDLDTPGDVTAWRASGQSAS